MSEPLLLRRGDGARHDATYAHPVIEGMFMLLPPAGALWPAAKQAAWLEAMERIFTLIYRDDL